MALIYFTKKKIKSALKYSYYGNIFKKMADLHITENLKVKELFFLRPLLKKKKKIEKLSF